MDLIETSEKKHFNKIAKQYDDNYGYQDPFTQYKMSQRINILKSLCRRSKFSPHHILDIGCGTGEYTLKLASCFPQAKIIGLDISNQILNVARKKCAQHSNISFVNASAYDSTLASSSFDLITGFYVLHHLDISKTIVEISRLLKKDGKVFFTEPNILNIFVYLIKSIPFIKKKFGDSPNEWAINPLRIPHYFKDYKIISLTTTEFIPRILPLPNSQKITLDKFADFFQKIPVVKITGSSIYFMLEKRARRNVKNSD